MEGSGAGMPLPLGDLTLRWGDHRNKELQIRTNLRNWMMEALDIRINVVRHDVGRIE